ncbi:MAG: hypothetical protein ACYTHJ_06740 [Planctomycetota bacterium]|jgi:hypothetical protein
MPVFNCQKLEYAKLPTDIGITRNAAYSQAREIDTFTERVKYEGGGSLTKKYSAFYPTANPEGLDDPSTLPAPPSCVFMLGWDHAMSVRAADNGFYADAIFAHKPSDANYEAAVFDLIKKDASLEQAKVTIDSVESIAIDRHRCVHHDHGRKLCKWRMYDLSARNIKVDKVLTFGVTSCSFTCIWPDNQEFFVISHIASAPAVPVFWIADEHAPAVARERSGSVPRRVESVISRTKKLNMIASLNTTESEQPKFTAEGLPHAEETDVEARVLLRGPERFTVGHGDDAPYLVHPYLYLLFNHASMDVTYAGALGFNNLMDQSEAARERYAGRPNLLYQEKPALHILGSAYHRIRDLTKPAAAIDKPTAQAALDAVAEWYRGDFGFTDLHRMTIQLIDAHDLMKGQKYSSPKFDRLMKLKCAIPDEFLPQGGRGRPMVRAAFRYAEIAAVNDFRVDPEAETAEILIDVWLKHQIEFAFPIEAFHVQDIEEAVALTAYQKGKDPGAGSIETVGYGSEDPPPRPGTSTSESETRV